MLILEESSDAVEWRNQGLRPAVCPWADGLTFLSLCFLVCKMGAVDGPPLREVVSIKRDWTWHFVNT